MGDTSDEILRAYIENVLRLQQERDRGSLSDQELKQIALDSGMSEADLEYVHKRFGDCLNRGQGFIRYKNWSDAIEELEQARALAPYNVDALNGLALAYTGRWREKGSEADRDNARKAAERTLELDSTNDAALRIVSGLRTERAELLGQETRTQKSGGARKLILAVLGLVLAVAFIAKMASGGGEPAKPEAVSTPESTPAPAPEAPPEPEKPTPAPEPEGIAKVALTFGREGIGPGQFTDARAIAADGAGRVYVAEYSSGRVQSFDSAGNFIQQWNVGEDHYVTGMAADQQGHVYVVHTGRIFRYDGATGKLLGEVKYAGGPGFRSVAVLADGGLAAGWDGLWRGGLFINPKSKDNLVIFDRDLHAVRTVKNIISSVSGGVVFSPEVAVDGLGNIFMIGESGNAIYRFTPQGKYVDKFGGAGSERGQMRNARGIAVDGHGRVFVTDFGGIHVFDGEGRYLGSAAIHGSSTDALAFNAKDELYAVARTKVMKMVVK